MRLVGWTNINTGEQFMADQNIEAQDCIALAFSGIHIISDRIFTLLDEYVKEQSLESEDGVRFPIKDFYLWAASRCPIYGVEKEDLSLLDVGKLDALAPAEAFVEACR